MHITDIQGRRLSMSKKLFNDKLCVNVDRETKELAMEYLRLKGTDISTELRRVIYGLAEEYRNK